MKKLSALVALVLCVTIGGVYAAWMYTGTDLLAMEARVNHRLEDPEFKTRVGVLTTETNTVAITIDQEAERDYDAVLEVDGKLVVHFAVNPGAPDDVVANGVECEVVLDLRNIDANLYKGSPIYQYTGTAITIHAANETPADENSIAWEPVEGQPGNFHATITAEMIDKMLDLGAAFNLPTYEDYKEFNALLTNIVVHVKVQPLTQPEMPSEPTPES